MLNRSRTISFKGEQPVFYFVPLACAGRKMADDGGKLSLIRQPLQFHLPQSQTRTIAAPTFRSDQQVLGCWIKMSALVPPPATDGCNSESPSIVIRAKVYKTSVARQVVNAMGGVRSRNIGMREVVSLNLSSRSCHTPANFS
jgi:hypothetical protein